MKVLLLILFFSSLLFSKVYYSKVEPYEMRDISSSVVGLVTFVDEDMIGKKLTNKPYLRMDATLNMQELKYIEDKLEYLRDMVAFNESILINFENVLSKKRKNYKRILILKIKSDIEKDREFHDLIASENQYLNTKKEINSLNVQITDLKYKAAYLKRTVSDKRLVAKDFVLYSILVKVGQVVGVATPLARVADVSSAKLTIYLDEKDVLTYKDKVIYIDAEKTAYKISRILNIADSKNISKYMAQIIIDAPKVFSKLVKVELRDE